MTAKGLTMKSVKRQSQYIAIAMLVTSFSFAANPVGMPSNTSVLSDGDALIWPDSVNISNTIVSTSNTIVNTSNTTVNTSNAMLWQVNELGLYITPSTDYQRTDAESAMFTPSREESFEPQISMMPVLDNILNAWDGSHDTEGKNWHYTADTKNVSGSLSISGLMLIVLASLGLANILGKKSKK